VIGDVGVQVDIPRRSYHDLTLSSRKSVDLKPDGCSIVENPFLSEVWIVFVQHPGKKISFSLTQEEKSFTAEAGQVSPDEASIRWYVQAVISSPQA